MLWPWLTSRRGRDFDWLQVEVTTFCNASCFYCPRTAYARSWRSRHLSLEIFRRLVPELPRARLVHLQGWGEPFLHPDLFAMLSLARRQGCQVSLTTNGMLLDENKILGLLEAGVEVLAFSLTGLEDNHNRARQGTDYEKVLRTIRAVHEAKQRHQCPRPALHLAYMVLRSALPDLPRLPAAVRGLGLTQIVLSTLDFVPYAEMLPEVLNPRDQAEFQDLKGLFADLEHSAQKDGLQIHYNFPWAQQSGKSCLENVLHACVIAADGNVSPCVFLNLPVQEATYQARTGIQPYAGLAFGSLQNSSLNDIWNSRPYQEFRRKHREGWPPRTCQGCRRLSA